MSSKNITVYMIGNAHIDPVWLWRWPEGFAEVISTCRGALDRTYEHPDLTFTRADAATYKWIEDSCPELLDQIRARVAEGRWSVVGGWWEQPDCNIPSGESFVRHELYGKRYLRQKLGVDVRIGYNVDSFGHNSGLPQILVRAGIDRYVFMRPDPGEKALPDSMFYWQGPDGSRVLCYRLHGPYCMSGPGLDDHINASIADRPRETSVAACFYGVGNHGGGPTKESIERIKRLRSDPDAPNLVFGTLEQFFEHALRERQDFPVVTGDLQRHAVGCYTAHAQVKMLNRRAENALTNAERFCAIAKIAAGRRFPKQRFADAWQNILLSQFHDILAGTSIEAAYEDTRDSLGAAIQIADYETTCALQSLACRIDTSGEGEPWVVFNPHPHTVKCAVCFESRASCLRDETGRAVPVQAAVPFFERTWPRETKVFVDYLPPLGYRTYYAGDWDHADFRSAGTLEACLDGLGRRPDKPSVTDATLRNDFYRLQLHPDTGDIAQIRDDRLLVDVLAAPAGAVVLDDPSDTWSHGVVAYEDVAGRFADARIELIENGPVRSTLRVESRFNRSTLWQDISLYMELAFIELRVTVDWREEHRMLRFEFPLNLTDPVAACDAAYAIAHHPTDGAENPCQKWVDVSGKNGDFAYGVSLINDGKHGYSVLGSTLRLSAIRSPIYAFHDPRQVERGKRYHYMDQGMHSFALRLLPHPGGWEDAGTVREALLLNTPPMAVETACASGDLPGKHSFGQLSEPGIELCALKEAEEDGSLIVRLLETAGRAADATLTIAGASYRVSLRPFELKTLRVADGQAKETDLLERG